MALSFSPFSFLSPSPQNLQNFTKPHSSRSPNPSSFLPSASPPSRFPSYPLKNSKPFTVISLSGTKITDFDTAVDDLDLDDLNDVDDLAASPWEGAVVYRRDASATHVEYCTTLERLGLARLSSRISRSRASAMGIRIPTMKTKESGLGNDTPVLISIDVTRRKRRLKIDGILRTVLTLGCNRCGGPAAESVFSNFALLLTENPVDEEDGGGNMGVLYGAEKVKASSAVNDGEMEEEDDEKVIDEDDKLYFPSEVKEIDLSKHIRDLIHVEITINSICSHNCRGLCLRCGVNLNRHSTCNCSGESVVDPGTKYGPLGGLRKQMESEKSNKIHK